MSGAACLVAAADRTRRAPQPVLDILIPLATLPTQPFRAESGVPTAPRTTGPRTRNQAAAAA